jgi:hypothetical protein
MSKAAVVIVTHSLSLSLFLWVSETRHNVYASAPLLSVRAVNTHRRTHLGGIGHSGAQMATRVTVCSADGTQI